MKILISICAFVLLFACKGHAQPPMTADEIDSLCNALEADFQNSVTEWKGASPFPGTPALAVPAGYYKDTLSVPMYFSKIENNATVLRIGEGTFEWVSAVSPYSGKFTQPELKENVFYFWNSKLIKITRRYSYTDYNFDPARYFKIIVIAGCKYFVDDKLIATRSFRDDSSIPIQSDAGWTISVRDIDWVAKAYAMLEAYNNR